MGPARRGRNLRAYRRAAARLRRTAEPICWICGGDIDLELPHTHADSFTADHVEPLALGGSPVGELRPAHRSCNTRRGDTTRTPPPAPPTSRSW